MKNPIFFYLIVTAGILLAGCIEPQRNQEQSGNSQQQDESFGQRIDKVFDDTKIKANEEQKAKAEQEARQVNNARPEITIKAETLFEEYNSNEVAADQKFKGKILQVVGFVDNIGKSLGEEIYITLKTDELIASVQCFFDKDKENEIAQQSKGRYVSVVGKCDGKIMNVTLLHCRFY
jgi:outer membrane murein-binding lipoprotein Lpp